MVTGLVEIRRLGTEKAAENLEFRRYVAAHHQRIEAFQTVAAEIGGQVECTACANCCRESVVEVAPAEIAAIARYLGIDPGEAEKRYAEPDPDAPALRILKSTKDGCIFLNGNLCSIYDARPKPCRDFPHVSLGTHSPGGRLSSLCRWAAVCPIVYNAIEAYKHQVGYHPRHTCSAAGHR